uniref:Secreted protein n=2 Tax=Macrostomum lignano TaxID=282301 RepID=A0A1I8G095_9PLAT
MLLPTWLSRSVLSSGSLPPQPLLERWALYRIRRSLQVSGWLLRSQMSTTKLHSGAELPKDLQAGGEATSQAHGAALLARLKALLPAEQPLKSCCF